jgi:anthranilate phosphoribosyltransferase
MKVPENARELLTEIAAHNDALGGAKCLVPLWAVPLALRALDYEAASGEVTEEMRSVARRAVAERGAPGDLSYPGGIPAAVDAALLAVAPLLSAAARRKALEEAAAEARQWFNGGDVATAIRALGRPA